MGWSGRISDDPVVGLHKGKDMERKNQILAVLAAGFLAGPMAAQSQVIFFTNNPTTNSTDWSNSVNGLDGAINTNVNFDTHPLGALQTIFMLSPMASL